jgi:hypothetical protein
MYASIICFHYIKYDIIMLQKRYMLSFFHYSYVNVIMKQYLWLNKFTLLDVYDKTIVHLLAKQNKRQ